MSRIKALLPYFFLALIFSFPDLYLWTTVDNFETPIRYYRGDTYHYLSVFRSAIIDGEPNANSFFLEQPEEKSQFFILQTIASALQPFKDVSIVWIDLGLRILVAFLVYLILTKLFLLSKASEKLSKVLAFFITVTYGVVAFKGFALGFWFLPALLGGIYCVMKFLENRDGAKRPVWPIFLALLLFAVHPVYFTLGGLAALLAWFMRLREERTNGMINLFLFWSFLAAVMFAFLYLSFIVSSPGGEDSLYRVVAVDTRLPIHPLFSLQLMVLITIAILVKERAILFFALASFIGLNAYIVTGTYIANDHYAYIIADFLAVFLGLRMIFNKTTEYKPYPILGLSTLVLGSFMFFETLRYLNFQPGYLGRWTPLVIGFLLISLPLFSEKIKNGIANLLNSKLIWMGVFVAILYAPTLALKDMRTHLGEHKEIQSYRPLIENFLKKEQGVVLAKPEVANVISLYTDQKVYWSKEAFSESVTDEELLARWMDASIFFSEDKFIYGDEAATSVMGNANRCMVHKRDHYYDILARADFPQFKENLCDTYLSYRALWPNLVRESRGFSSIATSTGTWQPKYHLDWLIVEEAERENLGKFLDKYFTFVEVVEEGFFVYHFKNGLP